MGLRALPYLPIRRMTPRLGTQAYWLDRMEEWADEARIQARLGNDYLACLYARTAFECLAYIEHPVTREPRES